jgi:hypothetical protein
MLHFMLLRSYILFYSPILRLCPEERRRIRAVLANWRVLSRDTRPVSHLLRCVRVTNNNRLFFSLAGRYTDDHAGDAELFQ